MTKAEKNTLHSVGRLLLRIFAGSLTKRIRKDPAGFASRLRQVELRYHDKAQKLGMARRENYKLRMQVQALKNERDLLLARLRMRNEAKNLTDPKQAAEAGAHEHANHASAE